MKPCHVNRIYSLRLNNHQQTSRQTIWPNWTRVFYGVMMLLTFLATNIAIGAEMLWVKQFGSVNGGVAGGSDFAEAVASTTSGIYVAGQVFGSLDGQPQIGWTDAFLRKYDGNGNVLWYRQFGTADVDTATAITTDGSNLYVAGWFGFKVFIRKYDANGTELWTKQFSTTNTGNVDRNVALAYFNGAIFLAGSTEIALDGQTPQGNNADAFVRKYDSNGNELWTSLIGTNGLDFGYAVTAGPEGIYVAGAVGVAMGGALPGQSQSGGGDVFIQKFDTAGTPLWARQFGTAEHDEGYGITNDASGVYVTGNAGGGLPGQTGTGATNAFIRKYTHNGNELWTRQFGISATTSKAISATPNGIVIAGTVYDALPGEISAGGYDSFARAYDSNGNLQWTKQFGSNQWESAGGIAAAQDGIYVVGATLGDLPGETNQGPNGTWDAYIAKISPLFSSLIGDKDDFQPGNPVDTPPKSARVQSILSYIATDGGQGPAANLDEGGIDWFGGTNRPVGFTHYFTLPAGALVSGAKIHMRTRGAAEVFNDAILYDQSFTASESDPACYTKPPTCVRQAYSPLITFRDLLGREPQANEVLDLSIDLSKVPVRTQTQSVPGGHWSAKPDEYRNLLGLLYSGQFNMVVTDDSAVDYSELSITYALPSSPTGDMNGDGIVDRSDLNIVLSAINTPAYGPQDPRDIDHDGKITILDVRKLILRCTTPGCTQ